MTSTSRRRWSFRTRLTAAMAAAFAISGAVLVLVQYVIFDAVFSSSAMATLGVRIDDSDVDADPMGSANPADDVDASIETSVEASVEAVEQVPDVVMESFASDVLGQTMLWSLLLVAVFALFAWLLAWLVARRAMGRVHEVSATAREITEQNLSRRLELPGPNDEIKELGDTLDSMLARLQSSFEAQARFIANASHELRTPLTATRLSLEVPLTQGRVPQEARAIVERALATTRRSERLVESLLTLARDPATLLGEAEPVDLAALVAAVVDEARPVAETHGIELRLEPGAEGQRTWGSALLLRQLVENLVDNAIAHNRPAGIVDIAVRRQETGLDLVVSNTGAELGAEQLGRLREPFERNAGGPARVRTSRPGIGLGLSIVDSIAAAHGGAVEFAPRPGGGLIASVTLPAGAAADHAAVGVRAAAT